MDKEKLRTLMKVKLSLISDDSLIHRSSLIVKNMHELFNDQGIIQKKIIVGMFAQIDKEPDLKDLAHANLLTAFPAFDIVKKAMIFKTARVADLESRKDFGRLIKGPGADAPEVRPDVILLPGIAFSRDGMRLGRGKGFYDKYLARYKGLKIGVCLSEQLIEQVPFEGHDVSLDFIVTDDEIVKCDKKHNLYMGAKK